MENNSILRSWNGKTIRQRPDGSLSLTDMANACGKLVKDWFQLKSTASYLVALVSTNSEFSLRNATSIDFTKWGYNISQLGCGNIELIETYRGSIGNEFEIGSWAHRRPALRFAQWCSDEFAIQVDTWIEEYVKEDVLLKSLEESLLQTAKRKFEELNSEGFIYVFVEDKKYCKIGFTKNINERYNTINASCGGTLEIVAVNKGFMIDESNIHNLCKNYHRKNEWFEIESLNIYEKYFQKKNSLPIRCTGKSASTHLSA